MELTYLVRGSDGNQYGPASLEDLTAWIKAGRVPIQQEVQRSDMQHWVAAEAFLELQPAFGSAAVKTQAVSGIRYGNPGMVTAARPAQTPAMRPLDPATVGQMRGGGSWFFWVAGLSLVNTIAALSGSDWRFILGLGVTQIIDAFAGNLGGNGKAVALVLDLLVAGVFVGFGVFVNKGHFWAFILGIVLFTLDGLIFLLVKDWIGVAFHAFVIFRLIQGASACRELKKRVASFR